MLFVFFSQMDESPGTATIEDVPTKAMVVAAVMLVAETDAAYTKGNNTSG